MGEPRITAGNNRLVVIAGGGYAGTTCAVSLGRRLKGRRTDVEVVMVEPNPCQQALSELDLVAVGPPRPQFCELWHPTVFKDLPVRVCYNRVADVKPNEHLVVIGDGEEVPYWRLVIATGAVPLVPRIPGVEGSALTMWSVEDAQRLQARVDSAFKDAARMTSRQARQARLSFVIVGGGATGVEIVGTMAQMLPKRMKEAGLDPADLRMYLLEARPDVLYDLPVPLRHRARRRLEDLGVEVLTRSPLKALADGVAQVEGDREIPAPVLVWAGGARADPHAVDWGLQADNSGRLVSGPELKAPGYDDIYVIGDVAAARHPDTGATLPMLAQMAIQEGPRTAQNILRETEGEPTRPFSPHMRGEFVSIGPSWGVGWMYKLNLTGWPGIAMKRITYVKYWLQVGGLPLAWKRTREMLAMQR